MKTKVVGIISLVLCAVMLAGMMPLSQIATFDFSGLLPKAMAAGYEKGYTVKFGAYPQTEVKDEAIIESLNSTVANADWKSYGYFFATNSGGRQVGNGMKYCDIGFDGARYRGVRISKYRPFWTDDPTPGDDRTDDNGYGKNVTYWFKWESLSWTVLDPATGLVVSKNIIDSQAFSNLAFEIDGEYYTDLSGTNYSVDYSASSVRQWLLYDFYNSAFSPDEKASMAYTTLDNSAYGESSAQYQSVSTEDKVFLLSYNAVSSYQDVLSSPANGTDYAKSQGLRVSDDNSSYWWLRSAGESSCDASGVDFDGTIQTWFGVCHTNGGVRPAFRFKTEIAESPDSQGGFTAVDDPAAEAAEPGARDAARTVKFGRYPQHKVTNEYIINYLDNLDDSCFVDDRFTTVDGHTYYKGGDYYYSDYIDWIILAETGDSFVLMSKNVLDWRAFGSFWHESEIREWLNGYFLDHAFSKKEKAKIKTTENQTFSTTYENVYITRKDGQYVQTSDKVYLLDREQAMSLPLEKRLAYGTDFSGGADERLRWHVRGPGHWNYGSLQQRFVETDGQIDAWYCTWDYGVRPVIKVDKEYIRSTQVSIPDDESEYYSDSGAYMEVADRRFFVGPEYFAQVLDSDTYDPVLANMLCAFSVAVYTYEDGDKIIKAYDSFGFKQRDVYDYSVGFDPDTCGYSIGIKTAPNKDTVFLIACRGSDNVSDWVGDFNCITTPEGKYTGFARPADRIYKKIKSLIKENGITGNVKYFITGHSRGAAVGNLLAEKLMENGTDQADVYAYTFACPDVACLDDFGDYENIFNLCNRADPVPAVPGHFGSLLDAAGRSWDKFGQTIWFTAVKDRNTLLDKVNPLADHNRWLYLEFFDQQLGRWDFGDSIIDKAADIMYKGIGLLTKVLCPVDVIVIDADKKPIASVINGEVNYYDSAFGEVIIFTDGDEKVIYIDGDREVDIRLFGTDEGYMYYEVSKYDVAADGISEIKSFDVEITDGKQMYSPVSSAETMSDVELFVVENINGRLMKTASIDTSGDETPIVPEDTGLTDIMPGDVNGDGDVLANDARLALRASAKLETLDAAQTEAADVDGDGRVLANDARQILRFSAKLQNEFEKAQAL